MVQTSAVDAFKRSLDERFKQFLADYKAVVNAIAAHGHGTQLIGAVTKLVEAARDMHDYLAKEHRPQWLVQIYTYGQKYARHPDKSKLEQFLNILLKNHGAIRQIEFADDEPPILDFDELFRRYRDEGKLCELFDDLIGVVNQIIATREVDSITALKSLEEIMDLLRSNRDGSYIAVRNTIFSTRYLKHLADVYLEKLPLVKELREAFDRLNKEAEAEFAKVDVKIQRETIRVIAERLPKIEQLPNYGTESDQFSKPLALPAPQSTSGNGPTAAE